ncbi:hypothetical protein B6U90_01915 [Thermoplasmatales archaeon ex4484_6]|nr:MAG: hypothetical protein B6U90_01915 [Thermoplasmatales archaeon ex4484_6]RLF69024.1 MAG: hypothetical protein DRN57_02160 [Thermoplasmata archaeon]
MYNPVQGGNVPPPENVANYKKDEVDELFSREPPAPLRKMPPPESLTLTKILLFAGVFAIFVGATLAGIVTVLETPDSDDYEDYDDYEKASDSYEKKVKWFFFLGDEFIYIGVLTLISGFAYGALANRELNPTVRMGLLIAAGIILGLLLTNKPGLLSFLNAFS